MILLKYIILIIILISSSFIGFLISRKYKDRVVELRKIKDILNIIETKIKFTYEPLGDIFYEISEMSDEQSEIAKMFKKINLNMKENDVKKSWNMAIDDSKQNLNINKEDIDIFRSLGNVLRENRCRRTNK